MSMLITAAEQTADDDRWAQWKADGRLHEVQRLASVRRIVAAACLGGALLLLLRW